MEHHIQRTLAAIDGVNVAIAEPVRVPPESKAVAGLLVLLFGMSLVSEPSYPPLAPPHLAAVAPEFIVDQGRLHADARNIEVLQALARQSDDPLLQGAAAELDELVTALGRGTINERQLLERLDALEQRLADHQLPETPLDFSQEVSAMADELQRSSLQYCVAI